MRSIISPWKRTVGLLAGVVGIAAFAHGQQPLIDTSANVVVSSGQLVPGLPGVTISTATLMDSACIDDSGAVIFRARLAGTGVTALNERAILRGSNYGNLAVLARSGDPAPGLPGLTLNTPTTTGVTGSPRQASNGFTFWGSSLFGPGVVATNDSALFSGFAGSMGLVVREGDLAPGTVGATFGTGLNNLSYQPTGVNRNGRVLFSSVTLGGDTVPANNAGWWTGLPGALELVMRKGEAAPGGTVIGALSFLSQMNDSGQVLVDAVLSTTLGATPANVANDQTLWIWTPGGGKQLIAREGDPAPGTVGATLNNATNNNSFFFNGGGDLFNNAGQGVVQCDLKGGDVIAGVNDRGLYLATTSGLTMLIRRGAPAAGTDGGFDTVNHATMHHVNGGKISFQGIVTGGTQTALNDTGIWAGAPGNLQVVMRENDPAPGLPAGVVFDNFLGTNHLLNEQGRVTVYAPLRGGDTVAFFNDRAQYCWDPNVGLVLVGRLQAPYQFAPGDTRALASFGHVLFNNGDGNPLGFNRNGQFALRISVTPPNNGSNGQILTFDFPTPSAPAITTQPSNAVACAGGSASFSVTATGLPYPTYQWMFNNSPLSNGGGISGATSVALTVNPVAPANFGSYTCVVTNSGGFVTTSAATLAIDPTDTDNDGTINCNDGCPNDPLKIAPGQCGCGSPDTDTDGDGTADCLDECPNDPNKVLAGVCGCGVPDVDTDGDGTLDCNDGCPLDPNKIAPGVCGCGIPDVDTDGDGALDCTDGCPLDPNKIAPGVCGCGSPDVDSDGDGTLDCNDGCPNDPSKIAPGVCGCGVPDVDTDGDGTLDCNDGCPLDPNKSAPGQCGCGFPDTDTDGDGTADCVDGCPTDPLQTSPGPCGCNFPGTDTDGDGVPDCNDGCPRDPNKTAPGICGCGVADDDVDGDGIVACNDNCEAIANPGQQDGDLDGTGDACDNCPFASNPTQADCDNDGIGDTCAIQGGAPDCNANGVPDTCDIAGGASDDANANTIPDECEQNGGTPFCFGYSGCPCGNNSPNGSGAGCINSGGSGAKLVGIGMTSVSNDTLSLNVTGIQGQALTKWFQATSRSGSPLGDGKLCMSGPLVRLGEHVSDVSGAASYPSFGDLSVSVKGAIPPAGGTRVYQAWYRNALPFCTPEAFNTTNGVSVVWSP